MSYLSRYANDFIFLLDADLNILETNERAMDFYGYTQDELRGRRASLLRPPETRDYFAAQIASAVKGGKALYESVHQRKDGARFPVEINVRAIDAEGKRFYQAVIRDITERKRAEAERLEMERRLLHAQKLESLGVLAGGIAHDFNNLLMAILGNMELALGQIPPRSPARRGIEEAIQAARRAEGLTRQMLAYSGKGRFVVADTDLSGIVEENTHLLRAAISKNTVLNLRMARNLPRVSVDAGQLQQVVMNLITNASESLGGRPGTVRIATGAAECDAARLAASRTAEKPAPGRFVWLEVTDTGCGMDEKTLERIFDPFFTTKSAGRGLGMSAVLGIVQGHRGAIMVESAAGRGSTVRVLLPASAEAPAEPGRGERAPAPAPPRPPVAVLVVDDEDIVRTPCAAMAEHAGYRAFTAGSGEEAVAILRAHRKEIGIAILDLGMPGAGGEAVFDALRAVKPDLRVILSSGYDEHDATGRFHGRGLAGFIQKPYDTKGLAAALERSLKGRP